MKQISENLAQLEIEQLIDNQDYSQFSLIDLKSKIELMTCAVDNAKKQVNKEKR